MRKVLVGMGVIAMAACGSGAVGRMAADGGEVLSDAGQALRDAGEWLADAGSHVGDAQAQDTVSLKAEIYDANCSGDASSRSAIFSLDTTNVHAMTVITCDGSGNCTTSFASFGNGQASVFCGNSVETVRLAVFR